VLAISTDAPPFCAAFRAFACNKDGGAITRLPAIVCLFPIFLFAYVCVYLCVLAALVGRQKQQQTAQAAAKIKGKVRQLAYPATATDSSSSAGAAAAMHYADVHQVHEYICEYFVCLHSQTAADEIIYLNECPLR